MAEDNIGALGLRLNFKISLEKGGVVETSALQTFGSSVFVQAWPFCFVFPVSKGCCPWQTKPQRETLHVDDLRKRGAERSEAFQSLQARILSQTVCGLFFYSFRNSFKSLSGRYNTRNPIRIAAIDVIT